MRTRVGIVVVVVGALVVGGLVARTFRAQSGSAVVDAPGVGPPGRAQVLPKRVDRFSTVAPSSPASATPAAYEREPVDATPPEWMSVIDDLDRLLADEIAPLPAEASLDARAETRRLRRERDRWLEATELELVRQLEHVAGPAERVQVEVALVRLYDARARELASVSIPLDEDPDLQERRAIALDHRQAVAEGQAEIFRRAATRRLHRLDPNGTLLDEMRAQLGSAP